MSIQPSGPRPFVPSRHLSPEERLFLARLAGLNAAFEAARAGARALGQEARILDEFLERCFLALTRPDCSPPAA